MYKSVSYSNMPMPVRYPSAQQHGGAADTPQKNSTVKTDAAKTGSKLKNQQNQSKSVLGFETDDLILLAVAFILFADGCDDKLLLAALAFIFLSDRN